METTTAINSEPWLGISLESVQEFLRMESIDTVEEIDLVRALIRWGKFRLPKDVDEFDGEKLRMKILPGLNLISFSALSLKDFAILCMEELGVVLSAKEKHSITKSIVYGDWSEMPPDVDVYNYPARKRRAFIVCKFSNEGSKLLVKSGPFNNYLLFKTSKKATLIGLKLKLPKNEKNCFTFEIRKWNNNNKLIGNGSSDKKQFSYRGDNFYKMSPACLLDAHTFYNLSISNPLVGKIEMFTKTKHEYSLVTSDGLTLKFLTILDCSVVEALIFEKPLQCLYN